MDPKIPAKLYAYELPENMRELRADRLTRLGITENLEDIPAGATVHVFRNAGYTRVMKVARTLSLREKTRA